MNLTIKYLIALIFVSGLFFPLYLKAQEEIIPLNENRQIKSDLKNTVPDIVFYKDHDIDTLELPFFDDFSTSLIHPNDSLWVNNNVFINNSLPVNPPTFNVATFDGLDSKGNPYDPDRPNSQNETADTLTSMRLNLAGRQNQIIYLHFFYQPQGKGDTPESYDSLVVEFKPDSFWTGAEWNTHDWIRVWRVPGTKLHDFKRAVIQLPVLGDTNYFHGGFQFRFINYANRSGNLDHWHVDYVKLYQADHAADTIFEDVAVTQSTGSILKKYHAMPRSQFVLNANNELREKLDIHVNHLYDAVKNLSFGYEVINANNNDIIVPYSTTLRAENINPFERITYEIDNLITRDDIIDEETTLRIRTIINTSGDVQPWNDTVDYYQHFGHYYAYDDGVAEAGFGVRVPQHFTIGKAALKFNLNHADSLRGVAMYFNRSKDDVSENRFDLVVWSEITPVNSGDNQDNIIYMKEGLSPVYKDTIDGYHLFLLDKAVYVSGNFYVGWIQNSDFLLNVGFDKNYTDLTGHDIPNPNLYYNVEANWHQTDFTGTPMIRPYLSSSPLPVSVKKLRADKLFLPKIYPNPANSFINITQLEFNLVYEVLIYDLKGRKLSGSEVKGPDAVIDIKNLHQGMYIVSILDVLNGNVSHQRLIVDE